MILNNLRSCAVLCDFDGTITTYDTNVVLLKIYGNKNYTNRINDFLRKGDIDLKEATKLIFAQLDIDEKEYLDFILNEVQLEKGFFRFYKNINRYKIHFAIVSGGFRNGIAPILKKHKIIGVPIYANKLIFKDNKVLTQFFDDHSSALSKNVKPNEDPKVKIYKLYKKKYDKVIFIGDGLTDLGIAKQVDVLFAKGYLKKYCERKNIKFISWKDFHDINRVLFKGEMSKL